MGWEVVTPDDPTKAQRRALYKFGIPRSVVLLLTKEQAATILAVLIEAIETVDSRTSNSAV